MDQGGDGSFVKLRKSLTSKNRKSKSSSRSSSSPPRFTAPDCDLDSRFAAQFDSVNKVMDKKLEMSTALMSKLSQMLAQFQPGSNIPSFSGDSTVPGYSGYHTEPPSLQTPVCTKSRTGLRFREGEEDPVPHESHLVQGRSRASVGKTFAASRDPPVEDSDSPQGQGSQRDPGFANMGQSGSDYEYHHDDKESVADPPPLDKTYARLVNFIHNRFPHSQPSTAAHVPPRCEFEEFFSVNDPAPSTKQNLKVYPRVAELVSASADRASRLARESRALHRALPLKRKMFYVGDEPDYCSACYLNPEISRISKTKNIVKTRFTSVTLADLEKLDHGSCTILAGDSQCFWLLSSLLAQLKDDGYKPSDPALFDQNISALSAALASQTTMAAGISDFVASKRRESYLAHASCPIAESVKRDLLVLPGTSTFLFDQPLLEKVVTVMKEDSLISSTASLASLYKVASRGRSRPSGSDRYSSPLDFSRAGPSGYRKRSASPARGSFAKRGHRGRGMTPSSGKGKGFQK